MLSSNIPKSCVYHTSLNQQKIGHKLGNILSSIANTTKDMVSEDQPHQNIIDPDLHVLEYDPEYDDPTDFDSLEAIYGNTKSPRDLFWPSYSTLGKNVSKVRIPDYKYRMCPCVIQVSINPHAIYKTKTNGDYAYTYNKNDYNSYDIIFLSKVFGIPYNYEKNSKIYLYFRKILQEMYPYIANILKLTEFNISSTSEGIKSDCKQLQVIVKSQIYNIDSNKFYCGNWHMDGALERVKCVCVWYYKIDQGMNGGELFFRPLDKEEEKITITTTVDGTMPQKFTSQVHVQWLYSKDDCDFVPVKENDIVIWDQDHIVHCVNSISIGDNRKLSKEQIQLQQIRTYKRGFLNFFIIDPNWPVPRTSLNFCDPCDFHSPGHKNAVLSILSTTVDKIMGNNQLQVNIQLPNDVASIIYHFAFPSALRTLDQSKKIRQRIVKTREEDGESEYFHNGNGGEYTFVWLWQYMADSASCDT